MNKVENFLIKNKVTFVQLIRCFNFWKSLTQEERRQFIDNESERHKYNRYGHY